MTEDICLYVLMRNDLASMNAGKACAQATHAANQCVARLDDSDQMLAAWRQDRGFGVCIVLSVTEIEMRRIVMQLDQSGYHAGITHDPSYPLRDGAVTHLIPLDTCAYAFGPRESLAPFLDHLELMS